MARAGERPAATVAEPDARLAIRLGKNSCSLVTTFGDETGLAKLCPKGRKVPATAKARERGRKTGGQRVTVS
jgi:hypothetical protein